MEWKNENRYNIGELCVCEEAEKSLYRHQIAEFRRIHRDDDDETKNRRSLFTRNLKM